MIPWMCRCTSVPIKVFGEWFNNWILLSSVTQKRTSLVPVKLSSWCYFRDFAIGLLIRIQNMKLYNIITLWALHNTTQQQWGLMSQWYAGAWRKQWSGILPGWQISVMCSCALVMTRECIVVVFKTRQLQALVPAWHNEWRP